jgi:hypothetical protein
MSKTRNHSEGLASSADPAIVQYLNWLAGRRGIDLPPGAVYRASGLWSGYESAAECLIEMPGYGVAAVVTMETLDDNGNVTRTTRMAVGAGGKVTATADQILQASGLTKGRKPRAAAPRFQLDPRESLRMSAAEMQAYCDACKGDAPAPAAPIATPAETVDPIDWQAVDAMPAPAFAIPAVEMVEPDAPRAVENAPADSLAALVARLDALETIVATLSRGDDEAVTPAVEMHEERRRAVRLRMARRYLAMRAQRDLDRRALIAGNAYCQSLQARAEAAETRVRGLDMRVEDAEFQMSDMAGQLERETARADAAEAIAAPILDDAQARIVRLEDQLQTWRQRAEKAGYRQPFALHALQHGTFQPKAAAA